MPVIAAALGFAALAGLGAPASTRAMTIPRTPAQYLLGAQNLDGGFGPAPGQPSTQLYAGWAALGLAASGQFETLPAPLTPSLLRATALLNGQTVSGSVGNVVFAAHRRPPNLRKGWSV